MTPKSSRKIDFRRFWAQKADEILLRIRVCPFYIFYLHFLGQALLICPKLTEIMLVSFKNPATDNENNKDNKNFILNIFIFRMKNIKKYFIYIYRISRPEDVSF